MTFASDIRQWNNATKLKAHLFNHDPAICNWVTGIVVHHTVNPQPRHWKGITSMNNMKKDFINRGWSAAPHLFIVYGSPNPADNGIWQMTPLNVEGVHARTCNPHTWGIEVVGNYMAKPWDAGTTMLVTSAITELIMWRNKTGFMPLTPKSVVGHRDCNPTSCPGDAINIDTVRDAVAYMLEYHYAR